MTEPVARKNPLERFLNGAETHVGRRLTNFGIFCLTVVECPAPILKTSVGLIATALSLVTLGFNKPFNRKALDLTKHSATILSHIYDAAIRIKDPSYPIRGAGDRSPLLLLPIFLNVGAQFAADHKKSFLMKHFVSRIAHFASALTAVITGVASVAFGLLLAPLSLFIPGFRIKDLTTRSLQGTEAIAMIASGLRGTINPHQTDPWRPV